MTLSELNPQVGKFYGRNYSQYIEVFIVFNDIETQLIFSNEPKYMERYSHKKLLISNISSLNWREISQEELNELKGGYL